MTVVDIFPFDNELDILEIRLATLYSEVDYFVIGESVETFAGREKPLYFKENESRFSRFASKIVHAPYLERLACHPFERDRQQKDALLRYALANTQSPDLLILGDVDEIPRPDRLHEALSVASGNRIAHLAQDLFFYYVNFMEVKGKLLSITGEYPDIADKKWLGTRLVSHSVAARRTFTELREPWTREVGIRITSGGWHFSYCGSHDGADMHTRVLRKFDRTAHQELNTERNRRRLDRRIAKGRDAFGRRGARFQRVPIDSTFPMVLRSCADRFRNMILT